MFIVRIYGGLGNQLFEYAFARALSLECKKECRLDISWFKKQIDTTDLDLPDKREYLLNNFNIVERYSLTFTPLVIRVVNKITNKLKILNRISKLSLFNRYWPIKISESEYEVNAHEICKRKMILMNGYWQDFKYFEKYEDIIRKELSLKSEITSKNKEYLNKILSSNSISLHFRRGDCLKPFALKIFIMCSKSYYLDSISYMCKKVPDPIFFVFSDDIDWIKSNFKIDYPVVFVESRGPDYEHLFLMSQCKHNIITNSTFSWWGAWLNTNASKIVIAPEKWRVDDNDYDAKIPESWLRFKNIGNK